MRFQLVPGMGEELVAETMNSSSLKVRQLEDSIIKNQHESNGAIS